MQAVDIKKLIDAVARRIDYTATGHAKEKAKEAIQNSPLIVYPDGIVGYVRTLDHLALFFYAPFNPDARIKTALYDIGDGVFVKNNNFEFIDSARVHFRICPNLSYEILE